MQRKRRSRTIEQKEKSRSEQEDQKERRGEGGWEKGDWLSMNEDDWEGK